MKKRLHFKSSIQRMKSIQTKIVTIIGSIVIVAMVLAGIVVVILTSNTVIKNETDIAQASQEKLVAELNNYFILYTTVTKQMAYDDNVRNLLQNVTTANELNSSPYWKGVYDMLTRTYSANVDNNFDPFVVDLDAKVGFNGIDWLDNFDLTTRDYWFKDETDIKRGYIITEPYVDLDTGDQIITVSAPVYNPSGSQIIGIVGIDVHINKINEMIAEHKTTYETDKTVLFSDTGVVLSSQDDEDILKNMTEIGLSKEMLDDLKSPSGDVIQFSDDGVSSYGVTGTIEAADWKILLTIPEKEFLSAVRTTKRTVTLFFVVAGMILLAVMLLVSRSITAPLKRLTAVIDEMAKGNLDAEINIYANDEVGRLADSMRQLTQRLHSYVDYIAEISDALYEFGNGNLTLHLEQAYDGEFERVKEAMMNASTVFKHTIGEMVDIASQVASSSEQVASGSQMLAQGTTEQASSIEELSATIQEISENVNKNAQSAMHAATQVQTVGEAADKSNEQMVHMMKAIDEINVKSSEIGKIIKTIDDIAFQTNILALNAAVEAARAGAAGKGFAVVADEVRNLASKSAEAAKNTTILIEDSIRAVENGTSIANETSQVLSEVLEGVIQTVERIHEISNASNEQADSLSSTLQGVEQISAVVQTNSATAEESSAASEELSSQAAMLKQLSNRFNLN
ncbi:methyl-accepting chemotaxis protein [Sinanaerobacter sp. ZZT-01]|uniref:methyl-accepting chemotaxis protein n=1 Tax=Sinanaerobacter sp. ZZT-01 TaxID=3111540 RepID=UPI002D785A6D|nr:methyl-accepting chemotaxis protein [Sinanaerobacter sp. ZZT-01]WRR93469.1 methyl-accepting chemotaxis protein [Sinanaerobacter sp. ZZT-01]